jgi:hypothetical protein
MCHPQVAINRHQRIRILRPDPFQLQRSLPLRLLPVRQQAVVILLRLRRIPRKLGLQDEDRLTKEEIEQMAMDGEKFAEEDKAVKEKVGARNQFENYIYQMKNSVEDKDKLAEKIADDKKSKIKDALTDS